MCELCTYTESELMVNAYHYDPTRSTTLRNRFARETDKYFNTLMKEVRKLFQSSSFTSLPEFQKVQFFNLWLDNNLNTFISSSQFNRFIEEAYKKGIQRARIEAIKARYKVPPIADLNDILKLSQHTNTLNVLKELLANEVRGIADNLRQQLLRVLSGGILTKDNNSTLMQKLISVIKGTRAKELGVTDTIGKFVPAKRRAEIMARTEIIRAHHLAMIEEYRIWGINGVYIIAEWVTAGDDRVCERCTGNEGKLYTLDEIEKMIPAHPLCRCIALPVRAKKEFETL